jgi:hypothetical protein
MEVEVICQFADRSTAVYVGSILENFPIDGPDVISLTSGFPAYHKFPRRIIEKRHIVSMRDYKTYEKLEVKKIKVETKTFKIKGKTGRSYEVKNNNGRWTCACIGFMYRNNCSHVVEAKSK